MTHWQLPAQSWGKSDKTIEEENFDAYFIIQTSEKKLHILN